ncbi:MAG: hypothetical protein V4622_09820 [Bacteroidota bacterium]
MKLYNKIMLYLWLVVALVSFIFITYYGFTEGFDRWVYYYVVPVVAILMYFFKKYMIGRMEKHLEYLEKQKNK